MKVIANENVFEPIIEFLRSEGHEVVSVRATSLAGASDDEIYKTAVENKYVIVTMDKDFARVMRFPPNGCGGIIVVKLYKMTVDETTELFKRSFLSLGETDISGNLVVITREGLRVRTYGDIGD